MAKNIKNIGGNNQVNLYTSFSNISRKIIIRCMIRLFFDGIRYFQNCNEFGIYIKKKIKLTVSRQTHKIKNYSRAPAIAGWCPFCFQCVQFKCVKTRYDARNQLLKGTYNKCVPHWLYVQNGVDVSDYNLSYLSFWKIKFIYS